MVRKFRNALELADAADVGHLIEVAVLLRDPQPRIGAARQNRSLGVPGNVIGELIDGGRVEEAAELDGLLRQRRKARGARLVIEALAFRISGLLRPVSGLQDGPIAGTAAQVAGDGVAKIGRRGAALVLLVVRVQGHDESRRAETALRAVAVDHRTLHRMERAPALQPFDGDDLLALERAEKEDAGVYGLVAQLAL